MGKPSFVPVQSSLVMSWAEESSALLYFALVEEVKEELVPVAFHMHL